MAYQWFVLGYRLLEPSCDILQTIGSQVPYECAVGVNGFVREGKRSEM